MRITVNDTELYFDVEGQSLVPDGAIMRERPTMLVVHGGPGFDHAYFKPALSEFADTVQIVYLDLRGQGRSGRPPLETCTLEQMADDIASFCGTLGIDRPIVLGHSAGGFVALNLAVRHPEVAGRLILVDTAAATADMVDTAAATADTGDAMATLEQRHGPDARAAAERMFGGDFSESSMTDFMRLVFPAYVCDPSKIAAVGEAVGRSAFNTAVAGYYSQHRAPLYDLRAQLKQIRVPTLVMVGDYDWLTPPSASRALAASIAHAELAIIPNAGHFAFLEQLDLWTRTVRDFLTTAVPVGVGGI